jgi:CubicO group peptidase (beta-lactamase class C family)
VLHVRLGTLLALVAFVVGEPRASAQDPAKQRLAQARARWVEAAQLHHVPGMAVVGVADGDVSFVECLGVRSVAGPEPVDADTRFYIASVTKTFVATAAKVLEERKKLELSDRVARLLPQFTLADARSTESMTLEDLLCHRPGLRSDPIVFRDAYTGQIDEPTFFRLLADVTPLRRTNYSNLHFTLAARALAAAGGATWQALLQELLFDPLEMKRTTASATVLWGEADAAAAHFGTSDGAVVIRHKGDRVMHAAGGLGTTPHDAARWLLFQLGDGTLDGAEILSFDGLDDLHRRRTSLGSPDVVVPWFTLEGYALAWQVGKYRGDDVCMHAGGYAGSACVFAFLPGRKVGAAALLNRDAVPVGMLALTDALDLLLGRDPESVTLERVRAGAARATWPAPPPPPVNPATKPGALTLPAAAYVGRFSSDQWGDLEVKLEQDALRLHLGDWTCDLDARDPDAFEARETLANVFPGRFLLDDRTVTAVELQPMGAAKLVFARVP